MKTGKKEARKLTRLTGLTRLTLLAGMVLAAMVTAGCRMVCKNNIRPTVTVEMPKTIPAGAVIEVGVAIHVDDKGAQAVYQTKEVPVEIGRGAKVTAVP